MSVEAEAILEDPYSPKTVEPKTEKVDLDLVNQVQHDPDKTQKQSRPIFFKEKEFKIRPSLLTTTFEGTPGIVFNYVIATFVLLWMGTIVNDIVQHKNPLHHLWLIVWNFEKLPLTLLTWTAMFGSTFLVFAGLKFWSLLPSKSVTAASESLWILGFLSYMIGFFYFSLKFLFNQQLNPACSFIITCESTRIAMKIYAFVRENIPRGIERKLALSEGREKIRPGEGSKNWPTPQQYIYYFFCPSFLYRDSYPMTESRDWSLVAKHLGQALGCIYFVNLLHIQFIRPYFDVLDYHKITAGELVYALFPAIIPGSFCLWMLFYGLLHCWLNMFSEAMYFGDRLFYANWWNSRNMAEYYRNWNLVVHEWLYAYVYKDLATVIGGKKGLKVAQVAVFFLSAFFHEFWFGVSLRIFYPIMFVLYFIFGGIFFSVSRLIKVPYVWNIAMWFNLLIGTGMFVSCYASECFNQNALLCQQKDKQIIIKGVNQIPFIQLAMTIKFFFLVSTFVLIEAFTYEDCNGYLTLEDTAHCGENGYFIQYGLKYCQRFMTPAYYNGFNSAGKQWVDCVGECLLTAGNNIVNEQLADNNINCTAIEVEAFQKHVDCYLNCGFCNICGKNLGALLRVYELQDFFSNLARQQITTVMGSCGLRCLWPF